jgi:beta-lactamase superfamily II metal-dependent hydrolase
MVVVPGGVVMAIDYIKNNYVRMTCVASDGDTYSKYLLWGDRVEVLENDGTTARVKARGDNTGRATIPADALGGKPLLELYFIDVGQGDGVLMITPDNPRRHILIDGGYIRERQPTGKNAADFVDWKFKKDYGEDTIHLDAMVVSHCDADHYGGLWDLINHSAEAQAELDCSQVKIDKLYHPGVSWWRDAQGEDRDLGPKEQVDGSWYISRLLEDENHARQFLNDAEYPQLQGEWGEFIKAAVDRGIPLQRLSSTNTGGFLPGFSGNDADSTVAIKILAPHEYSHPSGSPMLRSYGSNSQNTNGHSLLFMVNYGDSRILLTGDLNKKSMQAILEELGDNSLLQCDVTKGCHHGSDDFSFEFIKAMGAAVTVISSGDNEGHSHPRPRVVAASARAGHLHIDVHNDELITPMVYSTEISRSIAIGNLNRVRATIDDEEGSSIKVELERGSDTKFDYEVTTAGGLRPKKKTRGFDRRSKMVDSVTYGLVNVRTDGRKILCATLNENKHKWEIEEFESRF